MGKIWKRRKYLLGRGWWSTSLHSLWYTLFNHNSLGNWTLLPQCSGEQQVWKCSLATEPGPRWGSGMALLSPSSQTILPDHTLFQPILPDHPYRPFSQPILPAHPPAHPPSPSSQTILPDHPFSPWSPGQEVFFSFYFIFSVTTLTIKNNTLWNEL